MVGHRERVERPEALEPPAAAGEEGQVARERGRIARYVDEPGLCTPRERGGELGPQTGARGVGHDEVETPVVFLEMPPDALLLLRE